MKSVLPLAVFAHSFIIKRLALPLELLYTVKMEYGSITPHHPGPDFYYLQKTYRKVQMSPFFLL